MKGKDFFSAKNRTAEIFPNVRKGEGERKKRVGINEGNVICKFQRQPPAAVWGSGIGMLRDGRWIGGEEEEEEEEDE